MDRSFRSDAEAIVLYDEDCGFCRWSADRLRAWDRGGRLTFRSIQVAEREGRFDDLVRDARYASWHVITPDDRIWSAGAAVPPLMRRLPGGRPVAALATTFPVSTDRMYGFIARNRGRFGAALGRQACAVDPSGSSSDPPEPDAGADS